MGGTSSEPEPEGESVSSPEPEQLYSVSPSEPELFSGSTPEPELFSGSTPEPELFSGSTPEPELFSGSTHEPELSGLLSPEPENLFNSSSPEPEYLFSTSSSEPEYLFSASSSETEPYGEPKAEPEPEAVPETEPMSESWPEPGPEWSVAYGEWGVGWPLHIYIFGIIYFILFMAALLLLCAYLSKRKVLHKGKLTVSLLTMTIIFNLCRTISLFGDRYSTNKTFHPFLSRLLWMLPVPFLLSSFSLVLLALLDSTKFYIGPPRFQKLSSILVFTAFHFTLVLTTDISVYYEPSSKPMLLICQGLFILYGLLLTIGFIYTGLKIRSNCSSGLLVENQTALSSLIRICAVSAVIGVSIVATYIYSSVSVFGVYSDEKFIDAWDWWILQTVIRLEEISESLIVLIVASRSAISRNNFFGKCFKHCCPTSSPRVTPVSITVRPGTVMETEISCTSIKMKDNCINGN
ncbi:hypothetical protein FSP39_021053 [Pinctada imbricata]|uniref:Proline-rich transmembrane protein 3/4 domain-containing protein n=1 Tax=Pinctada imbricata TaxID=66713 RepID=A0AA88XJS8_PINIB|nr:hypothetical protein FSP39_021053 [Pinctada imbricata]